jgi:acetyl/propionyl-CoA carboxylase alpha subunit
VRADRDGRVQATLAGATHEVAILGLADGRLRYAFDGVQRRAVALRGADGEVQLALGGDGFVFAEPSPMPAPDAALDARRVRAPVAGVVSQFVVRPGDVLAAGPAIACVEAMKMEMWLHAPAAATVAAVHAKPGEQVAAGALLAELEPSAEATS